MSRQVIDYKPEVEDLFKAWSILSSAVITQGLQAWPVYLALSSEEKEMATELGVKITSILGSYAVGTLDTMHNIERCASALERIADALEN